MKKVLIFGTFDRIHAGHMYVFEQAQKRGDVFVVIARDKTVQAVKKRQSEYTELQRKEAVEKLLPNATVLLGDAEDYLAPIREISPDLILLGYDQNMPPGIQQEDLPCIIERLDAFEPEKYKSTILRKKKNDLF